MKCSGLIQPNKYTRSNEVRQNGAEIKNHRYKSTYGTAFFDPIHRERRKKEAAERNRNWRSLSLVDQLTELDKRFGKDQGAAKQRAKIKAMISEGLTHPKPKEKDNGTSRRRLPTK